MARLRIGGRLKNTLVTAPIDIAEGGPTTPLGLTVTIERERITLWWKSGEEGTEDKPKLVITRMTKYLDIVPALDDIAKRQSEHVIYLSADPALTLQPIAEMIDAVRPSFPDRVR
jgi:hypothetical protein